MFIDVLSSAADDFLHAKTHEVQPLHPFLNKLEQLREGLLESKYSKRNCTLTSEVFVILVAMVVVFRLAEF